jgi:hypothetical protein
MRRVRQTLNNRVTPRGNDYTGATGKFDGSFDVMERQAGTGKLSAELNYGEDGLSSNLHFTSPIILSHSNHTKLKA